MNKLQVDEKWTVYIVSNYVPTKYLLIKGKKKKSIQWRNLADTVLIG